jgi:hypothetical protein
MYGHVNKAHGFCVCRVLVMNECLMASNPRDCCELYFFFKSLKPLL